ncbi:MAG: vanadium-dependent haloperoxidase, partial [Litorilinea sp.]
ENRPFILASGNACPSVPPPAYSEEQDSAFYAEAWEVYTVVQAADPAEVEIARFWADDPGKTSTPPGHWVSILNQVLKQEHATLALAGESYARLGIGLADSFITCWHTKYLYNVPRPITYIQKLIDSTWNTPVVVDPVITPPFPEYTSGHSVQSGAAAAVLTDLFGENYAFTDYTHVHLGYAPRVYASFEDAAHEAAISRLYGGIHYRAAIDNGIEQGKCVGEQVRKLRFGK